MKSIGPYELRKRLLRGSAGNLAAVVMNQGSTFLISITVARILGKDAFGQFAMVQTTLVGMAGIFQLALGFSITKYLAEFRCSNRAKAERILGLCELGIYTAAFVAALILLTGGSWAASNFLHHSELGLPLRVGSAYVVFSVLNGYQIGVLGGLEEYGSLARAGALSGLSALAAVGAGASTGGNAGAWIGLCASAFLRWVFHAAALRSAFRRHSLHPTYAGAKEERRILVRFTLPAALASLYSVPLLWLGNAILARTSGYAELAIYSAAVNLRLAALFLPSVVNTVGFSLLNNVKGDGEPREYKAALRGNAFAIGGTAALSALAIALAARFLLSLFGKDFATDRWVTPILLVSVIPEALTMIPCQYLQSREHLWPMFGMLNVPREALLVGLACALAPRYGAFGLAAAYTAAQCFGYCSAAATARWLESRNLAMTTSLRLQSAETGG